MVRVVCINQFTFKKAHLMDIFIAGVVVAALIIAPLLLLAAAVYSFIVLLVYLAGRDAARFLYANRHGVLLAWAYDAGFNSYHASADRKAANYLRNTSKHFA